MALSKELYLRGHKLPYILSFIDDQFINAPGVSETPAQQNKQLSLKIDDLLSRPKEVAVFKKISEFQKLIIGNYSTLLEVLYVFCTEEKIYALGFDSISNPLPSIIKPHEWRFLKINIETQIASHEDINYRDLRFICSPDLCDTENRELIDILTTNDEPIAGKPELITENINLDSSKKIKSDKQIEVILCEIEKLNFEPMAIPDGGKSLLRKKCKTAAPKLFNADSGFDSAWKKALNKKKLRMANHDSFAVGKGSNK